MTEGKRRPRPRGIQSRGREISSPGSGEEGDVLGTQDGVPLQGDRGDKTGGRAGRSALEHLARRRLGLRRQVALFARRGVEADDKEVSAQDRVQLAVADGSVLM